MPDEVSRPRFDGVGDKPRRADLVDQALEFRVAFGAYPRTWIEFVLGVGHLGRAAAAEKLRLADANAAPQQKPKDWRRWVSETRLQAGG